MLRNLLSSAADVAASAASTVTSLFTTQPPTNTPPPPADTKAQPLTAGDFHVVRDDFQIVTDAEGASLSEQKYDHATASSAVIDGITKGVAIKEDHKTAEFNARLYRERYAEVHAIDVKGIAAKAIKERNDAINVAEKRAAELEKAEKAQAVRDFIVGFVAELNQKTNAKFPAKSIIIDFVKAIDKQKVSSTGEIEKLHGILSRFRDKIDFNFSGEHNADYHERQRQQILGAVNQAKQNVRELQKEQTRATVFKGLNLPQPVEHKAAKPTTAKRVGQQGTPNTSQPKPVITHARQKPKPVEFKLGNYKAALERSAAKAAAAEQAQAAQPATGPQTTPKPQRN